MTGSSMSATVIPTSAPPVTADQVFAKAILYEKCMRNGTPCIRYENFSEIHRCLQERLVIDHFDDVTVKARLSPV